jgi:hypothetical protein
MSRAKGKFYLEKFFISFSDRNLLGLISGPDSGKRERRTIIRMSRRKKSTSLLRQWHYVEKSCAKDCTKGIDNQTHDGRTENYPDTI